MSERLSPGDLAAAIVPSFQEEAASHKQRSELLVKKGHSLEDPHDDAATHQRMAEVYQSAAEQLGVTIKQFRRDLERAMNPYFKDYTDEQIDLIIRHNDEVMKDIEEHRGALT